MMSESILPLFCTIFFFSISSAIDTLTPSHPLSTGETLISANGTFALGFFTPPNTTNSYIGIWYHNIAVHTVVWVANRRNPIPNLNATLSIAADDASLHLITSANSAPLWSSPSFPNSIPNPIAQLLDTGNLVIKAPNSTSYLWQSFDYPSDTLLSGMKLGPELRTGIDRNLTSWLSNSDPSPGRYVLAIDPIGVPQLVIRDASGSWIWRGGPWNGHAFSGACSKNLFSIGLYRDFDQSFNSTPEEIYFYFNTIGDAISALTMDRHGVARLYEWKQPSQKWNSVWFAPIDACDFFPACGANAICDSTSSPMCQCLDGFNPRNPVSWSRGDWSDGCVRVVALGCEANETDEFMVVRGTTLPDTTEAATDMSFASDGCKIRCLINCSCKAFSSSGGTGCIIWMAEIKDLKVFIDNRPQDLYVRISSSRNISNGSSKKKPWVFAVASVAFVLLLVIILLCAFMIRRRKHKNEEQSNFPMNWDHKTMHELDVGDKGSPEISFFKFSLIVSATDNFSDINKLGQGGFGPVYKGKLAAGQEVAIKRLSARSGQGLEEFKNEILLIAKLQHRNLVRLLGCCIYGEEKMLIYEFMPNKSLDVFLFDVEQKSKLYWATRFQIIEGIAHGLLYLHKHSRLRIIHRDLKASNILLDADMNPKISDFGLARIFDSNDTEVNTRRIVGTFGYMSPEYAFNGLFSIKSDVFSFGVLLLEIVSGKRNYSFREYDSCCNLLEYAWDLWKKGNWMEIVDPSLDNNFQNDQMVRCIYVALLCVQERPEDRPGLITGSKKKPITVSKKKPWWVFVVASIASGLLFVIILLYAHMIRRRKHKNVEQSNFPMNWDHKIMHELDMGKEESLEISFFKFSHVVSATENFSDINKLGQGGFGPVYKGRLAAGQEVAIKRLSARSGQGLEEFKNEILLIAKLRHRNLVRLLGCCIDGEEKILIYEFMPNKSLDIFFFNIEQKSKLDWATRYQIIEGIAYGLFYLHKHSILRIIHRDLKASNILLDAEMNPKISDFGLARIFDSNDTKVNTRRIVGTFGYMSPEYVLEGRFSIKSDVFSFGVLLLEIVSGKRNHSFHEYESGCNLLGYAWDLWKKGNWMEIVDPSLNNNFQIDQMARCIYVALLCVQEKPEDRPGISDVIAMLGNENLYFNIIKQPAFFIMKNTSDFEWPLNQHVNTSSNGLTMSSVKCR